MSNDLTNPSAYAPTTVSQLADEREFKGAIRRCMAIVREIEDSGFVTAPDLYAQFRAEMRVFLQCADLRPFYGSAGNWGASTRDWVALNMLKAGQRMAPFNPRAGACASEASIVVIELLARWEASEGPAWLARERALAKEVRAKQKAAEAEEWNARK